MKKNSGGKQRVSENRAAAVEKHRQEPSSPAPLKWTKQKRHGSINKYAFTVKRQQQQLLLP